MDLRFQLFVLDLFVPLESNAVYDWILHHADYQPAALDAGAHILEKARGIESLHALVDLECIKPAAWTGVEIGADGIRLYPAIAFDDN